MKRINRAVSLLFTLIFSSSFFVCLSGGEAGAILGDIADKAGSALGESMGPQFSELGSNLIRDGFADAGDALEKVPTTEVDDIFDKLGTNIKEIIGETEGGIAGLDQAQMGAIDEAIRGATDDLKNALSADGQKLVDNTAIDSGLKDIQSEIGASSATFEKEAVEGGELQPAPEIGTTGGKPAEPTPAETQEVEAVKEGEAAQDSLQKNGEDKLDPAEPGFAKKLGIFLKDHVGMAIFGAFIFMVPNWVMGPIQSALTKRAELITASAPQYFGGIWQQIPSPLINQDEPQRSIPLYSRVTNPDAKAFYQTISTWYSGEGISAGASAGLIDNANFFVSSGNYDNCKLGLSWGMESIPSPNFTGQMIHLNSGLEFLGNGTALSSEFPYRQLTGFGDALHQCKDTNILAYLKMLAAKLVSNSPFTTTYNPYGGIGMSDTEGALALSQANTSAGSSAGKALKYFQALANALYTSDDKNLFTSPMTSISKDLTTIMSGQAPPGLLAIALKKITNSLSSGSVFEDMSRDFNMGPPTVRVNGERISGGFTLSAMKSPAKAIFELLGTNSSQMLSNVSFSSPLNAQGMFIYQTADTPWATEARGILNARGTPGAQAAAKNLYDYVVCLDVNNSYIPGLIPQIQIPPGGTNSKKPATIPWVPNPNVRYLFSLIDATVFDVTTGKVTVNPYIDLSKLINPSSTAVPIAQGLWLFFNGLKTTLSADLLKGPFVYGGMVISIPEQLKANSAYSTVHLYQCTAEANKGKTTLEGGFTDYLVPLTAQFSPVALPSTQHEYFASMVSSRLYHRDLTLASEQVDFTIMTYPPTSVYVGTPTIASGLLGQGAQVACDKCQGLQTSLGTLYQEYDLNPYPKNQAVLRILPKLTYALSQKMQQSSDPVYTSAKAAGTLGLVTTYLSARVVSSLQSVGLSLGVMSDLVHAWGDAQSESIDHIASVLEQRLTQALSAGITQGLAVSLGHAYPAVLDKLSNAVANPAIAKAFESIGAALKDVLPVTAQAIFDNLGTSLGLDTGLEVGAAFKMDLAKNGLIPVGAFYLYERGLNLGPVVASSSGSGSAQPSLLADYLIKNFLSIDTLIRRAHLQWKLKLLGQSADSWLLYEQVGPFGFTTKLIPNIIIYATSLEDIEQGDFVYQSSAYPGDYFIVASTLGSGNTVGAAEAFNALNPQPYLISLVTGTIYYRDPQADTVSILTDAKGLPQKVSNLNALRAQLKNQDLRNKLGVVATAQNSSLWKSYTFANFLLTLDPQDAANATYIYQDITNISAFPPTLSNIQDFFVGAQMNQGTATFGVPLESNPAYIVSLVTGTFYAAQGGFDKDIKVQPGSLLSQLPALRPALRSAIDLLVTRQQALQAPIGQITAPIAAKTTTLDSGTVSALLGSGVAYLASPYGSLKFYNGKYYGVTGAPGNAQGTNVQTIFDYSARTLKDENGRSYEVGILYDGQGNPINFYDGALLEIIRNKAGVVVSNGLQTLGVPSAIGSLDLLANGTVKQMDLSPVTMPDGLYALQWYANRAFSGLRILAHVAPTGASAKPYYTDLYTGSQFVAPSGQARIADYPVRSEKDALITSIGNVANAKPRVFAQGQNGYYYDYNFWQDFVASTAGTRYSGFQANGDTSTILAVTPADLTVTADWVAKAGQLTTSASGGKVAAFAPQGTTFKPAAAEPTARVYRYIGSGVPGGGATFEGPKTTWDPNYINDLIGVGAEQNDVWSAQKIFVSSLTGDQSFATANVPSAAYIECQAVGSGNQFAAVPLPDGTKLNYSITFYDTMVDSRTGAHYVAFADAKGIHFYVPTYQTTDAKTLQALQPKMGRYISLTTYGDIGLFSPLPPAGDLVSVAAVLGVPTAQAAQVQQAIISSNQFLYDASQDRYLYQYGAQDVGQPYAPTNYAPGNTSVTNPASVDLRSGVFYNANGIPVGTALTYPQLLLLLNAKGVKLPSVKADPTSYKQNTQATIVPQGVTLTKTTPFLLYTGS